MKLTEDQKHFRRMAIKFGKEAADSMQHPAEYVNRSAAAFAVKAAQMAFIAHPELRAA